MTQRLEAMYITQDIKTKETLTHDAGLDISGHRLCGGGESASSPLVGFGELNDNTIKRSNEFAKC
jgi:hypothetical protein